ncbi:MAG: hypothetical protein ABI623_05345 [bacterium]
MRKTALLLAVPALLLYAGSAMSQENVEHAVRSRVVRATTSLEQKGAVSADEKGSQSNQSVLKSTSQLESLGSEYAFGRSASQVEALGSEYAFGRSASQVEVLGSEYAFGRSASQIQTLGSEYAFGR